MDTSREDVGIAIRSAFLSKGTKQKFSLFALLILSIILLFLETIEAKPLNYFRAIIKDTIYRGALVVHTPSKGIKNGMAVLDGKNFIGRIVDVNFFSSRVLLVSDLNSKIPVLSEPSGSHAILSGRGTNEPTLEYLSKNNGIQDGDKIYTSGKEGIFTPGLVVGKAKIEKNNIKVLLFADLDQITFVNINLGALD